MAFAAAGVAIVLAVAAFQTRAETSPALVPLHFEDIASRAGVRFIDNASPTSQKYLIETMGGGVALIDYDGDGLLDLFFVNGAKLQDPMNPGDRPDKSDPAFWNRLYHNNGDGTFTDVTVKAGLKGSGYDMGVAVADYDNDGHPDLYVTGLGRNTLYHNNGDGTFSDVTSRAGVGGGGWSTSAMFLDYDKDGFLDLAVTRYLKWDFGMNIWCGDQSKHMRAFCHPGVFQPESTLLFHNNRDGTFTDVSGPAGFSAQPGNGLGIAFNDFDRDGWPDIAIANDTRPQQLFHNLHDGKFEEVGMTAGIALDDDGKTFAGMGIDFRDYDNDGWPDIFITDLATQNWALFRNDKGTFQSAIQTSHIENISQRHSGWGADFADFDNDGWKDLFVAQSHVMDNIEVTQPGLHYLEPPLLLRNERGRFADVSPTAGDAFRKLAPWRGVAVGDINNDGSEDVVVTSLGGGALVLRNAGNENHWITINTVGTISNRDGIGAQLHIVSSSGREQWDVVSAAGSYLSSRDKRVHFGLGSDSRIRTLEIDWPSGVVQTLRDLAVDRILTVSEPPRHEK